MCNYRLLILVTYTVALAAMEHTGSLFKPSSVLERSYKGITEEEMARLSDLISSYQDGGDKEQLQNIRTLVCKCRNLRNQWIAYSASMPREIDGQFMQVCKHLGYDVLRQAIDGDKPAVVALLLKIIDVKQGLADLQIAVDDYGKICEKPIETGNCRKLLEAAIYRSIEMVSLLLDAGMPALVDGNLISIMDETACGYIYYKQRVEPMLLVMLSHES
jgi:hypothetical protein